MRIGIHQVLNSPTDIKGESGENKTGAKVSLYTVHVNANFVLQRFYFFIKNWLSMDLKIKIGILKSVQTRD